MIFKSQFLCVFYESFIQYRYVFLVHLACIIQSSPVSAVWKCAAVPHFSHAPPALRGGSGTSEKRETNRTKIHNIHTSIPCQPQRTGEWVTLPDFHSFRFCMLVSCLSQTSLRCPNDALPVIVSVRLRPRSCFCVGTFVNHSPFILSLFILIKSSYLHPFSSFPWYSYFS